MKNFTKQIKTFFYTYENPITIEILTDFFIRFGKTLFLLGEVFLSQFLVRKIRF